METESLDSALEIAQKLHSIEVAQEQLLKHLSVSASTNHSIRHTAEVCSTSSNAVSTIDITLKELSEQVVQLSEEMKQLRQYSSTLSARSSSPRNFQVGPKCWNCGRTGHLRRNCQVRPGQNTNRFSASHLN